jgi:hypothetical protein
MENYRKQLNALLYQHVPMMIADEVMYLVDAIVKEESRQDELEDTLDAMMRGEALRDQMKLHAILHGAYDHLVPQKKEVSDAE